MAFGIILIVVNICVVTLDVGLAAHRSHMEPKAKKRKAKYTAKKVESALTCRKQNSAQRFMRLFLMQCLAQALVFGMVPRLRQRRHFGVGF